MYFVPSLLLLQTLSVLTAVSTPPPIATVFVGEHIMRPCGGEGVVGHWFINDIPTNVTASQFVDTIAVVDGKFNYDGTLRCDSGYSYHMKAYGLRGVAPFPSNCSSTDSMTNTCTVSAAINSSLTLCADFTYFPSNAPRFANTTVTYWKSGTDWLWYCDPECTQITKSLSVDITPFSEWGACARVESIHEDVSLSFLFQGDPNPANEQMELHNQAGFFDRVDFIIQGERPLSSIPSEVFSSSQAVSATILQPTSVLSVASSSVGGNIPSSVISSLSTTPTSSSEPSASILQSTAMDRVTSVAPAHTGTSHPPFTPSLPLVDKKGEGIGAAAAFGVLIFLAVITAIVIVVYMCLFKKGYLKTKREWYIKPQLQSVKVITSTYSMQRPSNLPLKDISNAPRLPSTSTLKPLISSTSVVAPNFDPPPETTVTEVAPPYAMQTSFSSQPSPWSPDSPRLSGTNQYGSDLDLFRGGLDSNSQFV